MAPENVTIPTTNKTGERTAEDVIDRLKELRHDLGEVDLETRGADDPALRSMFAEVDLLDSELTVIDLIEGREAKALMPLAATRGASTETLMQRAIATGGRALMETDEVKAWIAHGLKSDGFGIELPFGIDGFQTRAGEFEWATTGPGTYVAPGALATGSDSVLLPVGQPIPPIPRHAKLYLRDLIPKFSTTLARVPYVRELAPTDNESGSAVTEGTTKPSTNLNFQGASADPTVLAATLTISKQLWEDAALVVQYINMRLPYIVKFKEDQEFLQGDGNWPNILGIEKCPGLLTQATITPTDWAPTLGQAFAQIEEHDGEVTAVVFYPSDAWSMFTKRAAGGAGTFDAGTPFSALPLTAWGVPTYRTRAHPQGQALVGDFTRGATIVDREQVNVQTYRERYAELNEILLICEERVGLMIQRPDLFCEVALS